MRQVVSTDQAPKAIGPYSQGVRAGQFVFLSGQVGFDPATGQLVPGGISEQTHRTLQNIGAILSAAGLSFDHVVKTTVFLADMSDFAAMNDVYASYFESPVPARSTIQAARLPRDAKVEIEIIAQV
jgi:2-iminobutanoate/2-iminopropanoate deaminase